MSVYNEMTKDELKQCSLLAAEAFYDYEYFSIYIPEDKRIHSRPLPTSRQ